MLTPVSTVSKKIYVAIDESVHSVAALNFTLNNMARPSDIITVIMITESEAEREVKIAHAKTLIRALADPTHTDKFFAVRVLCSERAGEAICKLVDETQPDILVLGSSGKSHLESFFLGSVSQYCIQNANCPLVVARPTPADEQKAQKEAARSSALPFDHAMWV